MGHTGQLAIHQWSQSPKSGLEWDYGKVHATVMEGSAESPPRAAIQGAAAQQEVIRSLEFNGGGHTHVSYISEDRSASEADGESVSSSERCDSNGSQTRQTSAV